MTVNIGDLFIINLPEINTATTGSWGMYMKD